MEPCKKGDEFPVCRNPRINIATAYVVSKAKIAAINYQSCFHPRQFGWTSGFFQPLELDLAGSMSHHVTLNMDFPNKSAPPSTTQRALTRMPVIETKYLQFDAVRSGM